MFSSVFDDERHHKKVLESIFKAVTAKKGPSCLEGVHPSTGAAPLCPAACILAGAGGALVK